MPLVWASRLQGEPCPERVAGSSLLWLLAERAAAEGRSLYLLGGNDGAADAAKATLIERWPSLKIVGTSNPWISNPPTEAEVAAMRASIDAAKPDIVLVGFGSPKQEKVIHALRDLFPKAWFMGVGISFSFVAGHVQRAPSWMQATGLEWMHRLAQEPKRLARRYLLEDLPFSVELFARAVLQRSERRGPKRAKD